VKRETRDLRAHDVSLAQRFEAARDKIVAKWGEKTYRAFRVYLWGGGHAFRHDC
jgi:cyclopropane-fatty-acyl-phospholipid synthase